MKRIFPITMLLVILVFLSIIFSQNVGNSKEQSLEVRFLASDQKEVEIKNEQDSILLIRGSKVFLLEKKEVEAKVQYQGSIYFIPVSNLVQNKEEIVQEKEMYVRTSTTLYESDSSSKIEGFLKKGEKVEVIGYDILLEDGSVSKYKVRYQDKEGYIRSKYLVPTKNEAIAMYDYDGSYQKHLKMGNSLGGGSASTLDYYPVEKPTFSNNKMPEEVRALYLNAGVLKNIDAYIDFAKENNINAFVVDIKDNTVAAYEADSMSKYSKTNFNHAIYTKDEYKKYIQKLKDNGFYVIGRITVFKDSYYVIDHPKDAILNTKTNSPLKHNDSYWPSPYSRNVWEFNVELAKESIRDIGFHEIQFDYVRFPDRMISLEQSGIIDYNNVYKESKAEAIQSFVMYAADEIHDLAAYISVDVFGESAQNYVTAYGQYWPAISNVVDVISGMPYPDHFDKHQYGIEEVVWTVPYKLLKKWGEYVVSKQELIPTPAKVRTWIQAYDTKKEPATIYDDEKVSEEIKALYENGLTGGYMTWNSSSKLSKYEEIKEAFRREYQR